MATIDMITAYDEFLEHLAQYADPQAILAFHASDEAQARAELLTTKNKQGFLTPDETAELEQMMRFNRLVALLKAKAIRSLHTS